ncbi:histone-lysine N-methyltransferase SETMAR-like [Odontomachus brunneus]|uniref:histone-lysine N-methyltransferase SETMAR-like n=1 Tax=Odontomachus brunneus TaxID=486640 RepID=UPI0013F292B5|nr:histone-lysine N-methyltransferase SETMAR-like [Odontomachus brunneus]
MTKFLYFSLVCRRHSRATGREVLYLIPDKIMSEIRVHFRHFMLYEFRKGNTATSAKNNIYAVYRKGVLSARTCRKWFDRFRKGNFNLEDEPRAGRLVEADEDRIRNLVNETRSLSVREMSQILNMSKSCVHRHLKEMGMVPKLDVWVPHQLTERNRLNRVATCISLLARNEMELFLKRVGTENEKWIMYESPQKKRTWTERENPAELQNLVYTLAKFFFLYGITKEFCYSSCFRKIR